MLESIYIFRLSRNPCAFLCFSKKIYVRGRGKERKAIVEGEEKAIGEGEGKVIREGERWNGIEKVGGESWRSWGKG